MCCSIIFITYLINSITIYFLNYFYNKYHTIIMKCRCKRNCIISRNEVLEDIQTRYNPCSDCYTKKLKKSIPIKRQLNLDDVDKNYKKCTSCNKRHIDTVMAHVLKIMVENGFLSTTSSIRKVGTPLITPAVPLKTSPYLPEKSLVLITQHTDNKTSEKIYNSVPEIKSVIKGDINNTVGQLNENNGIHNYKLQSGCDIRCDIQKTDVGEICLYKPQSKIHIEYPKEESLKLKQVNEILNKYDNPTVLDAMCGAGTLGIYALLKNAKKVHFNDIYDIAVDTTETNLKLNNIPCDKYEITQEDICNLSCTNQRYDVGLIDAFPGVDTSGYETFLKKICKEIYII